MEQLPFSNRLKKEQSPYLLSHASTPVQWFPWGEEAFKKSKEEDKPIFLSIGDISSYWCRVMLTETFSNEELAEDINDVFVCIKVDSEEMPHIAGLYAEFAQMIMSSWEGIWPLNMVLTSDLMPFFAAHYISSGEHQGIPGMVDLINKVKRIWKNPHDKELVIDQAHRIVNVISLVENYVDKAAILSEQVTRAANLLYKLMDPIYGGLKTLPKLPSPLLLFFLLRHAYAESNPRSLYCVRKSLDMMSKGSIHDHIGGGFYCYAIDEQWLLPGFEKHLIDNAWMALVSLETWSYTGFSQYHTVLEDILEFLVGQMKAPNGGFYSSEYFGILGQEADFYGWSFEEISEILGKDADLFCEYYNIHKQVIEEDKKGILHIDGDFDEEEFAKKHNKNVKDLQTELLKMKKILLQARNQRYPKPFKDDQILAVCNGMMIHLLSKAALVCHCPEYMKVALETAEFCENKMRKGRLLFRRWRNEEARFDACLEDYAAIIMGYLSLLEADCGFKWLEKALELADELEENFLDCNGAFYVHNGKDPNILVRLCDFADEERPAGNSLHVDNLIRLYHLTGEQKFKNRAKDILEVAKRHSDFYPMASCYYFSMVQKFLDPQQLLLIVVFNQTEEDKEGIQKLFSKTYMPHISVIWYRPEKDKEYVKLLPYLSFLSAQKGKTTIYACFEDRCERPIMGLEALEKLLKKL